MFDLSIIIPHYNSVETLSQLLLSIPRKENIQVIVIDDKSDKQSTAFDALKKNKRFDHILFLSNNTNKKGAGVCRNIGLDYAKGKWLLFADADDLFTNGFYEILSEYFTSDYDVIFFKPTSIEVDTGKLSDRHLNYEKLVNDYLDNTGQYSESRLKYRFFVPWSKLINKNIIKKNNILFDEVIASNDVMFSTKVGYYIEEFLVVPEVIYCVTRGYGTLTTKINSSNYDIRISVFIKNYLFLKKRLGKKEFKALHLHGLGIIIGAIKNKQGFKKVISVFLKLKKNKVNILDNRFFNPLFAFKQVKVFLKKHVNERKYYTEN